jgi:hypothetical protein
MPAGAFEPPPTYAEVILVDDVSKKSVFNPIWLKWFIDLAGILSASGGGSGAILHNSLSALQGGTASEFYHLTSTQNSLVGMIVAGTYTPTLTNTTNVAASTAYLCQYLRVGTFVTVSGRVDVDPTAAGQVVLGITIPVASNFAATDGLAGVAAASAVAGQSAALYADAANDRATLEWIAVDTANRAMHFTFSYRII